MVDKEGGRLPVNNGGLSEEHKMVAGHMGGTRRFVPHPGKRQKKDHREQENQNGTLSAVPILDHGLVAQNGEHGGDGAG